MLAFLTHLSYNKNRIIIYWETPDIISECKRGLKNDGEP